MFNPDRDDFVIENRSQLIYALTEATALEHLLMCQYLFAAASLKTHVEELSNRDRKYHQIERVRYWKRKITEVAREEMQHLAMAMNLLVAVGGAPTFDRQNFPVLSQYYRHKTEDGSIETLTMTLEGFGGSVGQPFSTIDRFLRFEKPREADPQLAFMAIPIENIYDTVGQLYDAIAHAFETIPNVIIDTEHQYDPSDQGQSVRAPNRPDLSPVARTIDEAKAIIAAIVQQGEGSPASRPDPRAHFEIFRGIRAQYEQELAEDPDFRPARDVVPNPLTRPHDAAPAGEVTVLDPSVDEGVPHDFLQLFAGAYEVLLGWLGQLFSHHRADRNPPSLQAMESLTFLPFMSEIISPLAELMTQVPISTLDGRRLGPSFEVTSNDFLIPSTDVASKLTRERLAELAGMADDLTTRLGARGLKTQASDLAFIAKSLHLMAEEFESRAKYGWPPAKENWDAAYAEAAPDDPSYDFSRCDVLELRFEGVFQCRLATDPDGAAVKRGVTGNGFAIGDEPDLDRVIRFQADPELQREHAPPVGVRVTSAVLFSTNLNPTRDRGRPLPQLRGALIDLLDGPAFGGRNHLVSEDGEPIDPFTIEVRTDGGRIRRTVLGEPINDMTPLQRRGSGRYPVQGGTSADAMYANLALLGRHASDFQFSSPLDYTQDRLDRLQDDYDTLEPSERLGKKGASIAFRIQCLKEGLARPGEPDARGIRWTRYFFDIVYQHFVTGPMEGNAGTLGDLKPLKADQTDSSRWLVKYQLGFFDTDAMSACITGSLLIPIEKTSP